MGYEVDKPFPLNFSELSAEPLPPSLSSLYLWDTCRHGKLFLPESYEFSSIQKWMGRLIDEALSSVTLPQRFDRNKVSELLKKTISEAFSKNKINESFTSVNAEDVRSLEQLIRESAEQGRKGFETIIQLLKSDDFPPILWMELGRYVRFSSYVMDFLQARMKTISSFRPKQRAEAMRRSKEAWSMSKYYGQLAVHLANSFLGVFKMFLFLELWSCENEKELFGDKPWTFQNVDVATFENMMIELHSSIDELNYSFLHFRSLEPLPDFSEPIGWAFKQLVQIA